VTQICRPIYSQANSRLEYTFPLGAYVLDDAIDTQKQLFMKFVLRMRTATQSRMRKYVSTSTAIVRSGVQEKCKPPVHVDSSLADILRFDMLDGLLHTDSQFDQTDTSFLQDITGAENAASTINVNIATPLTFMLRIDDGVLASVGMDTYGIDVVSIFTMYFISNVKKDSMLSLLNTRRGFTQFEDGSIDPDDELLRICPLHRIRGVYGCISRFEVQSGLYEFESTSVLPIAPDADVNGFASETWAQAQRTASVSFVDAVRTHTGTVRNNFHINAKSRQAFVVSQDVPWSEDEFRNDPSLSHLQYPQVRDNVCLLVCALAWAWSGHILLEWNLLEWNFFNLGVCVEEQESNGHHSGFALVSVAAAN
jgi:hypothetical protein